MKYHIWRHHTLRFTGTFEECKAYLIKHDGNAYENCTRAMVASFDEGMDAYTSLQGQLWLTEYASIKPTDETLRIMNELDNKAQMEVIDHLLMYGE